MDETIRIRSVEKSEWSSILQGFQPETMHQVLEVYGSDGQKAGTICESLEGQSFINGQPKIVYDSLQAAATALIKELRI